MMIRGAVTIGAGVTAVLLATACGGHAPAPAPPPAPTPVVAQHDGDAPKVPNVDDDDNDSGGVTMVNARGRMDVDAIQAGIAPFTADLGACYTTRVGRRRWLGGHVGLHWDIRANGEISAVQIAESDLGAWQIEHCLLDVARQATFAKPNGGDADFSVPLDFSAKGKSAAWDEDKGMRAVGGQLAALDTCASAQDAGKSAKRGAGGGHRGKPSAAAADMPEDVVVTVYVGPHGQAQSVGFSSTKAPIRDAWADCAEKVAMAWRLPDPRGEVAKLAIRYRAR